ncbi:hypothetical protein [Jiangella alkaliphila]|uniref:Enoyl reductase n=1 Tax=Jiangella alkaliphila TaxID=419479 RepID=A0A1H2M4S0_9ACTN|nr:hypothetical protein [Jiangella alkaliphila]SDU88114.1 hypothetical protein SAMN04488563_7060 [Jiangella alkaliphila]
MRRVVRVLSAAVASVSLVLSAPAVAGARGGSGGDDTGDGYEVGIEVTFTGDGAPGGGGTYTVPIPPVCWWVTLNTSMLDGTSVDATDPQAVMEWYEEAYPNINGSFTFAREMFPDRSVFENAIAREAAGEDVTWYRIEAGSSGDPGAMASCSPEVKELGGPYGDVPVIYYPWAAGDPPEPAIDPETLAIEARDVMVIDEPEVDRNPKLSDGLDGATFVNVDTWFWVVDPEMVGGSGGTRTIRADIVGTDVWAEVTATTDGLSIASPNGSRQCDPERALRVWEPDAADADGCTVAFTRASVAYPGGYPVTAATEWTATWEGQEQDGTTVGGDLDPLRREATVNVPVAEVQTIVKRTR